MAMPTKTKVRMMLLAAAVLLIIIIIILVIYFKTADNETGCVIDLNNSMPRIHPLLLNLTTKQFLMPENKGNLSFKLNDKFLLSCTGTSNYLKLGKKENDKIVKCAKENKFLLKSDNLEISSTNFSCNVYPESLARRTGRNCSGNFTEIEIGFETSLGFLSIMKTCFDNLNKNALYSRFNLSKNIKYEEIGIKRPSGFEEGNFYDGLDPNPSVLYTKRNQLFVFSKLLKSEGLARKYVQLNNSFFLSRGHLTAKADYIYGSQQRATFHYVNVAPQWQIFNEKNWGILEDAVRDYVAEKNQDHIVITGVWGKSTLLNVHNEETVMFLWNKNGTKLVVPEIFWKIVYEPMSKTAAAFVGHNNPYEIDITNKTICPDICNQLSIKPRWNAKNITLGYSYCCSYQDLKNIVYYIPDIQVTGLLR